MGASVTSEGMRASFDRGKSASGVRDLWREKRIGLEICSPLRETRDSWEAPIAATRSVSRIAGYKKRNGGVRKLVFVFGVAALLLAIGAYSLIGPGLRQAAVEHRYELVDYWSETDEGSSLRDPFAIAVDNRTGNVFVTDSKNQRVVVFDDTGAFLRAFGSAGDGPGQFQRPTGVAIGPEGAVYVADAFQDRIQKFDDEGNFVGQWGEHGKDDDEFDGPHGLAVDGQGRVYVADFVNKGVKRFNADGEFSGAVGRSGQWGAGALDYPTDVAVAASGRLLVADAYNYRIQAFDSEGEHQANWGRHLLWLVPRPAGGSRGFTVPSGVALDAENGLIHVADSGNRRLVMLDAHGRFVNEWALRDPSDQYSPSMVAVSPDGSRIYATDIANDRVIVLEVR